MKHLIIYISILLLSISALAAQDSDNKYTHQAGFNVGTFFGLAPTYRYNAGNNAVQVSALPIFNNGELSFNGSLGYLRKIARAENVDFSFVTSIAYGFTPDTKVTALNAGTQIEIKLGQYITLEGRAGFLVARNQRQDFESVNSLTPSGGIAVMYNFVY